MDLERVAHLSRNIVLRDPRSNRALIRSLGAATLLGLALTLRLQLTGVANADYIVYISPWFDHLDANGLRGFGEEFANYNFPYLFLLYVTTTLPVEKIVAFKLIGITFDFVLAAAAYLVVVAVTGRKTRGLFAALAALFLPTVFINSSLWGQSDAVYTSFVLLSLASLLHKRYALAWVLFGVALAFKLQAVFFLPVLVYVWMKRRGSWLAPVLALPVYLLLSLPPVLFGRSLRSTLGVYLDQYGFQPELASNTPNAYFWLPQDMFDIFNRAGLVFAAGVLGLLLLVAVLHVPFENRNLVYLSALFLLVAPFVLPQMHDRYFYPFEVLCLVVAAVDPERIWLVFTTQLATFSVYSLFLFQSTPIPFTVLGVFMVLLLYVFVRALVTMSRGNGRVSALSSRERTSAATARL